MLSELSWKTALGGGWAILSIGALSIGYCFNAMKPKHNKSSGLTFSDIGLLQSFIDGVKYNVIVLLYVIIAILGMVPLSILSTYGSGPLALILPLFSLVWFTIVMAAIPAGIGQSMMNDLKVTPAFSKNVLSALKNIDYYISVAGFVLIGVATVLVTALTAALIPIIGTFVIAPIIFFAGILAAHIFFGRRYENIYEEINS